MMKLRICSLIIGLLLLCGSAQATDYAKRFPNDTALAVVTPTSLSSYESDPLSLHLDQTIQQTVTVNEPIFQEGIAIGDGAKTIKKIDDSTVGLYINGELIMSWNNSPDAGQYLGFGAFTQA